MKKEQIKNSWVVSCFLKGRLDTEFDAAFEAASFQHKATGFGAHPSTKPVNAGTVTSFWLVSSLWHI